jgi:hypothetical protein
MDLLLELLMAFLLAGAVTVGGYAIWADYHD